MAKELLFMNKPVVDAGEGKLKVSKEDFNAIQEELGVTKEVRKVIKVAEETIAEEAAKFTGAQVLKQKIPVALECGSGGSKVTFSMGTVSVGRNPQTGEETETFGRFSIRKRGVVCAALKSGALVQIQAEIESAFKKKK